MEEKNRLKNMIQDIVLIDIEDSIDDILAKIASKKETKEDKKQLNELQEMQKEFNDILKDINNDKLNNQEIDYLIQELTDYINGDFDE
jgi:predicted glutamine amidotransferase